MCGQFPTFHLSYNSDHCGSRGAVFQEQRKGCHNAIVVCDCLCRYLRMGGELNGWVDELNGWVDELNRWVNELNGRINELSGMMDELNGWVYELNGRMNELNG